MRKLFRTTALVTSLIFVLTDSVWPQSPFTFPVPEKAVVSPGLPEKFTVPETLGRIQAEYRSPELGPYVVVVQDAHAVLDAQIRIQELIHFLQTKHGLRLVALEGGQGKFDPTLLRTFPDRFVKRKVLGEYLREGELTGAEMAAILNSEEAEYHGIEDWELYEEDYFAYLRALRQKKEVLKFLDGLKKDLDREGKKVYSAELKEFHDHLEAFEKENAYLLELLSYLSRFEGARQRISDYPELWKLFESLEFEKETQERKDDLESSVRQMAEAFKGKYSSRLNLRQEREFNQNYQAFVTGETDAGNFLKFMTETARSIGVKPKLTPLMLRLLGQAETLTTVRGTKLFEELQALLLEIEEKLVKTPEEASIAKKYHELRLLKDLASLEITRDQLEDYQRAPEDYLALLGEGKEKLRPALEFYRLALERDRAFRRNLVRLLRKEGVRGAIVLAGGFHAKGFETHLKAEEISYAVVAPRIQSLEGEELYPGLMEGNLSYKEDLKTGFYDAFQRRATLRLVSELSEPEFRRNLKLWRDEILRTLAKEGRTVEARVYLRYLDLLLRVYYQKFGRERPEERSREEILKSIEKELNRFRDDTVNGIWQRFQIQLKTFMTGLETLIRRKELTVGNVSRLLAEAGRSEPFTVIYPGPRLVLDPSARAGRIIRYLQGDPSVLETPAPEALGAALPAATVEDYAEIFRDRGAGVAPAAERGAEAEAIVERVFEAAEAVKPPEVGAVPRETAGEAVDQLLRGTTSPAELAARVAQLLTPQTQTAPATSPAVGVPAAETTMKTFGGEVTLQEQGRVDLGGEAVVAVGQIVGPRSELRSAQQEELEKKLNGTTGESTGYELMKQLLPQLDTIEELTYAKELVETMRGRMGRYVRALSRFNVTPGPDHFYYELVREWPELLQDLSKRVVERRREVSPVASPAETERKEEETKPISPEIMMETYLNWAAAAANQGNLEESHQRFGKSLDEIEGRLKEGEAARARRMMVRFLYESYSQAIPEVIQGPSRERIRSLVNQLVSPEWRSMEEPPAAADLPSEVQEGALRTSADLVLLARQQGTNRVAAGQTDDIVRRNLPQVTNEAYGEIIWRLQAYRDRRVVGLAENVSRNIGEIISRLQTLQRYGLPQAKPLSRSELRAKTPQELAGILTQSPDPVARFEAAQLLGEKGDESRAVLLPMTQALRTESDRATRRALAKALHRIVSPETKYAAPLLIAILTFEKDGEVQDSLAAALDQIYPDAQSSLPVLIELLQTKPETAVPEKVVTEVAGYLGHEEAEVRRLAAVASGLLGRAHSETTVSALASQLRQETDLDVKRALVEAVSLTATAESAEAVSALVKVSLEDPDFAVQQKAAEALAALATTDPTGKVVEREMAAQAQARNLEALARARAETPLAAVDVDSVLVELPEADQESLGKIVEALEARRPRPGAQPLSEGTERNLSQILKRLQYYQANPEELEQARGKGRSEIRASAEEIATDLLSLARQEIDASGVLHEKMRDTLREKLPEANSRDYGEIVKRLEERRVGTGAQALPEDIRDKIGEIIERLRFQERRSQRNEELSRLIQSLKSPLETADFSEVERLVDEALPNLRWKETLDGLIKELERAKLPDEFSGRRDQLIQRLRDSYAPFAERERERILSAVKEEAARRGIAADSPLFSAMTQLFSRDAPPSVVESRSAETRDRLQNPSTLQKLHETGYGIHAYVKPLASEGYSGDWYKATVSQNERFGVFEIGDSTGHGLQANRLTAMVEMAVDLYEANGTLADRIEQAGDETERLRIFRDYFDYLTAVVNLYAEALGFKAAGNFAYQVVLADYANQTTYELNAGQEKAIYLGGERIAEGRSSLYIGSLQLQTRQIGGVVPQPVITVHRGARRLILLTDGVTDTKNEALKNYGADALRKYAEEDRDIPGDEALSELVREIHSYQGTMPDPDDRLLVVVDLQRRVPSAEAGVGLREGEVELLGAELQPGEGVEAVPEASEEAEFTRRVSDLLGTAESPALEGEERAEARAQKIDERLKELTEKYSFLNQIEPSARSYLEGGSLEALQGRLRGLWTANGGKELTLELLAEAQEALEAARAEIDQLPPEQGSPGRAGLRGRSLKEVELNPFRSDEAPVSIEPHVLRRIVELTEQGAKERREYGMLLFGRNGAVTDFVDGFVGMERGVDLRNREVEAVVREWLARGYEFIGYYHNHAVSGLAREEGREMNEADLRVSLDDRSSYYTAHGEDTLFPEDREFPLRWDVKVRPLEFIGGLLPGNRLAVGAHRMEAFREEGELTKTYLAKPVPITLAEPFGEAARAEVRGREEEAARRLDEITREAAPLYDRIKELLTEQATLPELSAASGLLLEIRRRMAPDVNTLERLGVKLAADHLYFRVDREIQSFRHRVSAIRLAELKALRAGSLLRKGAVREAGEPTLEEEITQFLGRIAEDLERHRFTAVQVVLRRILSEMAALTEQKDREGARQMMSAYLDRILLAVRNQWAVDSNRGRVREASQGKAILVEMLGKILDEVEARIAKRDAEGARELMIRYQYRIYAYEIPKEVSDSFRERADKLTDQILRESDRAEAAAEVVRDAGEASADLLAMAYTKEETGVSDAEVDQAILRNLPLPTTKAIGEIIQRLEERAVRRDAAKLPAEVSENIGQIVERLREIAENPAELGRPGPARSEARVETTPSLVSFSYLAGFDRREAVERLVNGLNEGEARSEVRREAERRAQRALVELRKRFDTSKRLVIAWLQEQASLREAAAAPELPEIVTQSYRSLLEEGILEAADLDAALVRAATVALAPEFFEEEAAAAVEVTVEPGEIEAAEAALRGLVQGWVKEKKKFALALILPEVSKEGVAEYGEAIEFFNEVLGQLTIIHSKGQIIRREELKGVSGIPRFVTVEREEENSGTIARVSMQEGRILGPPSFVDAKGWDLEELDQKLLLDIIKAVVGGIPDRRLRLLALRATIALLFLLKESPELRQNPGAIKTFLEQRGFGSFERGRGGTLSLKVSEIVKLVQTLAVIGRAA
jgi:hypothetical protein